MRQMTVLACGALLLLTTWAGPASARWAVGIGIGLPIYAPAPRVYYPYYAPYYYPPPVIVQPVYPAPVVVQPTYVSPAVPAAAAPVVRTPEPVPPPVLRPVADGQQADVERRIQHLSNPDAKVRADVAIELGKMKANKAVDALTATLAGDASATVREAAARGLGLIGSDRALPALRRAAQGDDDRDVRNSARFAVDVIQTNR
jgi:hypothetical protein